jgi:hypothetical protein
VHEAQANAIAANTAGHLSLLNNPAQDQPAHHRSAWIAKHSAALLLGHG